MALEENSTAESESASKGGRIGERLAPEIHSPTLSSCLSLLRIVTSCCEAGDCVYDLRMLGQSGG
jgi:hypothetical protein